MLQFFCTFAPKSNPTKHLVIEMTNVIKIRKGLDISLTGGPSNKIASPAMAALYSLVPDDFHGVTPKVVVKEGEHVDAGVSLFIDKNNPSVKFVSPVSGIVTKVERGARRKVMNIMVKPDANQTTRDFGKQKVSAMNGSSVLELLLESGLFAFFRQRPYDVVPSPGVTPRSIHVSAFDTAPFAPKFEDILQGQEKEWTAGLEALAKIAKVYLGISAKQNAVTALHNKEVTEALFDGPHPAGLVGVQINKMAPVNKGEVVWTFGAEEVLFIGRLLMTGKIDFTRTITVAGENAVDAQSYKVLPGAQLSSFVKVTDLENSRVINGNVLTGNKVQLDGFLGARSTQVTVIPEVNCPDEPFGWIMPRTKQFSVSHSYFSWLCGKKKEYSFDARIKGGERHMIMSGEYETVFPMDIFPEYLVKAVIAGNIDDMEALGIYEVAPEDFALCEFVCSSKVQVQRIIREGLDSLREEMC